MVALNNHMPHDVAIIIVTYGDYSTWGPLGLRALQSAEDQDPGQIIRAHTNLDTTISMARNVAANAATTEWLLFLDGDDELENNYVRAMMSSAGDLRYPNIRYVNHGTDPGRCPVTHLAKKPLSAGNFMVIGTMVRRELFLRVGGFPEYPAYEDWALWYKCWINKASIVNVPGAIYRVHRRPNSRNQVHNPSEVFSNIITDIKQYAADKGVPWN